MIILYTIIYSVFNLILFNRRDIFHPRNSIIVFNFIFVIPYLILYIIKGVEIFNVITLNNLGKNDYIIVNFILLSTIALISFNLGVSSYSTRNRLYELNESMNHKVKNTYVIIILITFVLGFYYFNSLGGISYYLNNVSNRSEITKGAGALSGLFYFFIYFSSGLLIYSLKAKVFSKKIIFFIFLSFIVLLLLTGSRSLLLRLLFIDSIIAYYVFKPSNSKLFSIKNKIRYILGFLILMLYVVVIPFLRSSTLETNQLDFKSSISEGIDNLEEVMKGNIYTEIQLNILNYFEENKFWYGKSYLDLLTVFLPRSIYPDKPSADDGLYIYNMLTDNTIVVGETKFSEMYIQSWPPSSFGALYANFGIWGILLGYLLLGLLMSKIYDQMKSNKSYVYLFIYSYCFWRLQFSNLLILEVFMIFIYSISFNFLCKNSLKIYK